MDWCGQKCVWPVQLTTSALLKQQLIEKILVTIPAILLYHNDNASSLDPAGIANEIVSKRDTENQSLKGSP